MLYEGRAGEGTAHAGAYELCPQTLRHGERPEPACAQGERCRFRHGRDGCYMCFCPQYIPPNK